MTSPPGTRLFLVRHGATTLAAEDRFAGSVNVPLSDVGREQAAHLAERLAGESIAAVFSSTLERAIATAQILAAPHRLEVQTRAELREIGHGHWERLTPLEVAERFPEEAAAWEEDPFTFAPVGGESGLAVTARALPALIEIVRAHAGQHVLVVSHKGTIRLLLSSLLGFDPRRYRDNLDQSPAALNIVDFRDPTRGRLTLFNDVSHYSKSGLSMPGPPRQRLSRWWSARPGR